MKNISVILFCVALCNVFTACNKKPSTDYFAFDGFAIGTTYHIVVQSKDTTGIKTDIESLFERVNASMSVYRENSLLNRLNRNETDSLDKYIIHCIGIAEKVSMLSGGEYDITIKPLTEAWGFTGQQAQAHPDLDSLLQFVGFEKISVHEGRLIKQRPEIQLELNSIAKGYAVDLLAEAMASRGISNFLIEVGGEIVCKGKNPKGSTWVIGIDKPEDGNNIAGETLQVLLSFTDMALATSGNYRKFYVDADGKKVVHTINARTGESSPSNLLSATVLASDCATADALGTMMMVIGLERSIEFLNLHPEYMAYLVFASDCGDYQTYITPNLQDKIVER